ncbi:MAG: polysaccharide biosynthesis/export family protein [Polyangiales bacterium]
MSIRAPLPFALSLIALASVTAGCHTPLPGPWPPIEAAGQTYRIGPGDVLRVSVFGNQDLNTRVTVRPDGRIALPLLDELAVAGRTVNEVTNEVSQAYRRYVQDARVAVVIEEVHSYRVFVTGKVQRAGEFESATPLTVMQALALAGGGARGADMDAIVILRRGANGRDERYEFSYNECSEGRTEMNFLLRSGDTIIVP